jgi:2-polyprenyl-3-methyl-5-hydroxy-6-metoxy-1,4-benzoquinol methylase
LTLPAARKGIQVTGVDLAASLVQQARAKAADEGLRIQVDEGDAENLPYPDASFDVVMSLIGSMFAPRQAVGSSWATGRPKGTSDRCSRWSTSSSSTTRVQAEYIEVIGTRA